MIEQFPKIKQIEKPNEKIGLIIRGRNSVVSDSAVNVYESGANNNIGPGCKNISILNSSGCVVLPGINGATIINSSGVIASEDNQMWVNNSIEDKRSYTTASSTSFALVSIPVYSGAILIEATVLGLLGSTSAGYVGKITAGFRLEAGNLILIGSAFYSSSEDAGITTGTIEAVVSGENAQIKIAPENTTVNWSVSYKVQKI